MAYRWNPLWRDPEDAGNAAYVASIRRMIIASINWLAEHPDANPDWREPNRRALARRAGVSDDTPVETIAFIGCWEEFFTPANSDAAGWFAAIETACEMIGGKENAATVHMFGKAIASGLLFRRDGWEGFDRFMLERRDEVEH